MAAYNERMLDVCRETGAHCLDLAAVVPSTVEYFWDDCHLTDRAQSLIGETLASALREPLSRRAAAAGASAVAAR
jgi:phospholipase/lecithinase/hemolysin